MLFFRIAGEQMADSCAAVPLDPLSNFLHFIRSYHDIVKFITVSYSPNNHSHDAREIVLKKAKDFIFSAVNVNICVTPFDPLLGTVHFDSKNDTYREILFLRHKWNKIRREILDSSRLACEQLIVLLQDPTILPSEFSIDVNFATIHGSLSAEDLRQQRIRFSITFLVSKASASPKKEVSSRFSSAMHEMISQAKLASDRATNYFPPNTDDSRCERMIFDTSFQCAKEVSAFLASFQQMDPKTFTMKLMETSKPILKLAEIRNQDDASVCLLFLIRAFFSQCYSICPQFFYKGLPMKFISIFQSITLEAASIPSSILPPHGNSQSLMEAVLGDNLFSRAALHISFACLYTNPIDALFEVHEALTWIGKGAEKRMTENGSPTQIIAQEITFGLFLGALTASQVPNIEDMIEFISSFTPSRMLSPEFEFALATLTAGREFYKEVIKESKPV